MTGFVVISVKSIFDSDCFKQLLSMTATGKGEIPATSSL